MREQNVLVFIKVTLKQADAEWLKNVTFTYKNAIFVLPSNSSVILDDCQTKTFESINSLVKAFSN